MINMKKISLILLAIWLSISILYGQETTAAQLNYYNQELFINPAFAGSQDVFSSTIGLQRQWADIKGAPNKQRLQAHSSFINNKLGLGINMQHDAHDVSHTFNLSTNYAYRIKMSNGTLALGLQLGFATFQASYSELYTPVEDPLFSENVRLMWGFSCGIGAYYNTNKYYIGLSAPYLVDNSVKEGGRSLVNRVDFDKIPFYLAAGYVLPLNEAFNLKPSLLLGYSKYNNFSYNANLTLFYRDKYWVGALARKQSELGATFGLNILDYMNFSYAFTVAYGNSFKDTNRGVIHEISLNVLIDLIGGKPRFRYF